MNADDVRARFEAWARGKGLDVTRWNERKRGALPNEYMKLDTDMAWAGYRAAHADLFGEVREWRPAETAPDGELVDVWVGSDESGFRYANAVKLGGIWCDRHGYRLTLKAIRLWIKSPAEPALAKFTQEKP